MTKLNTRGIKNHIPGASISKKKSLVPKKKSSLSKHLIDIVQAAAENFVSPISTQVWLMILSATGQSKRNSWMSTLPHQTLPGA